MKIKVSEATISQLDYMVARAYGHSVYFGEGSFRIVEKDCLILFQPTTDWTQGGPIIGKEKIELLYHDVVVAGIWYRDGIGRDEVNHRDVGPTTLIAAMRCYVRSKLGDEVHIPESL